MKKLLSILGAIGIVASSTSSVIACGGHKGDNDNPNGEDLTDLQKQMLDGAEFMTKLILAGRHENLNYNVNEILSSYMAPISTMSYIPQVYKYNGQKVDVSGALNAYKTILAPSMNSFDKDNYSGFYASYVMGMYDDSFYNNFLSSRSGSNYFDDTMNKNGDLGFNKSGGSNTLGFAAGLNQSLHLASDTNRKDLAWGIQDTGALTNYLLDKGYDGGRPGTTNGTRNPVNPADSGGWAGGTNASGYLFYNSISALGKGHKEQSDWGDSNIKFGDNGEFSLKDQSDKLNFQTSYDNAFLENASDNSETSFGESGALFAKTAANLNANGFASSYTGMVNSITKSTSGAEILANLTNLFLPVLVDDNSSRASQEIASSLIIKTVEAMWSENGSDASTHEINQTFLDALKKLDNKIDWNSKFGEIEYTSMPTDLVKITDWISDSESATKVSDLMNQIQSSYKLANDDSKSEFWNFMFREKTGFFTATQMNPTGVVYQLKYDNFKSVVSENNGQAGIDLLNIFGRSVDSIGKYKDVINNINNEFGGNPWKKLDSSQKLKFAQDMGWNGSQFTKDSFGEHAYTTLKDSVGSSTFASLLDKFADITSSKMEEPHKDLLQYMVGSGDNSWTSKNEVVNADSNMQQGATMSFTLDYNGVGDSTSNADQQTTRIDSSKLDNFNPYQTKLDNQKDKLEQGALDKIDASRTSGVVLGKDQLNMSDDDLMNYDGTGMLANIDNNKVHHYYKVEWTNVSNDAFNPYWVISSIHSFNDKDQEFYSIY